MFSLRGDQQMDVVRHQHIGVQLAGIASGGFLKAIEVGVVIIFTKETRFTVRSYPEFPDTPLREYTLNPR